MKAKCELNFADKAASPKRCRCQDPATRAETSRSLRRLRFLRAGGGEVSLSRGPWEDREPQKRAGQWNDWNVPPLFGGREGRTSPNQALRAF